MNGRGMGLKRLAALYDLVEHARGLELGQAAAAVAEVERAVTAQAAARAQEVGAGLIALSAGEATQWAMARAVREAAEVRVQRLAVVRDEREVVRERAGAAYRASRMEKEQTRSAMDRIQQEQEGEAARRLQRAVDDRYVSRREWIKGEDRRRATRG